MDYNNEDKIEIYQANKRIEKYKEEIEILNKIASNKEGNEMWNALKELLKRTKEASLMETVRRLFDKSIDYEKQNVSARDIGSTALGCDRMLSVVEDVEDNIKQINSRIETAQLRINAIHQKYKKIEEKKQQRYGGKNESV